MNRRTVFLLLITLLCALPGWATSQRSFVAHYGLDTNPCTVASPCRSFAAAIATTSSRGEVVAIDSAGYGPMTITQAVTIVAPLGVHAAITASSGDGVTVNAGPVDGVALRNLYINSQGGANGITYTTGAALSIEHCVVSGFSNNDINLVPLNGGTAEIVETTGRLASGSGVYANSASPLTVSISHSRFEMNHAGVLADRAAVAVDHTVANSNTTGFQARGTGGPAIMAIESCVAAHNVGSGVLVNAGDVTVHNTTASRNSSGYATFGGNLTVDHCVAAHGSFGVLVGVDVSIIGCMIVDNGNAGIYVQPSAKARIAGNTISGNLTGIDNSQIGGSVYSAGDNILEGNTTDYAGTAAVALNKA